MVQKLLGKTPKKVTPPHRQSRSESKQRKGRVARKNASEPADAAASRAVRSRGLPRARPGGPRRRRRRAGPAAALAAGGGDG